MKWKEGWDPKYLNCGLVGEKSWQGGGWLKEQLNFNCSYLAPVQKAEGGRDVSFLGGRGTECFCMMD